MKFYWVEKVGWWWHRGKRKWVKKPVGFCSSNQGFKNKKRAFSHAESLRGKVNITEFIPSRREGRYYTRVWSNYGK